MLNILDIDYSKNKKIIEELEDKYGLIPARLIIRDNQEGHLRLLLKDYPDIQVFPHSQIYKVIEILTKDDKLWNLSSFKVSALPPIIGRAPIFGVPLKKAFKEALKIGIQKSRFAIYPTEEKRIRGFLADLLIFVKLSELGKAIREIETWEDIWDITEVFYGHIILDINTEIVSHFDCSTINIPEVDKRFLFENSTKIKGTSKQKYFRIDGELPLSTAVDLMRAYFPIEELINEAFDIKTY